MSTPRYPLLYQINTRVWLTELSRQLGRPATLDDISNAHLDSLAEQGFDWIWLLSVWQTTDQARQVSLAHPGWRKEFEHTLPDLTDDDIAGSGFAIAHYDVAPSLGGDAALARLRARLASRGLWLMLDFVPNHMGLGHFWSQDHPDHFIQGSESDLAAAPQNFTRVQRQQGDLILAHGRDPYFDGWPDTLQLNYANPLTQAAMIDVLVKIADQCDGVRCDMAMLVLPGVFERTWGQRSEDFWPRAIAAVRKQRPDFCFMAEVYWDLEWTLQQQGFDFAYDKRLYDRLHHAQVRPVREHLLAGLDYQNKLARFLENHDEPRAAATLAPGMHEAAAAITYLSPGLRFFHQGQFEGCRQRISPHLGRGPEEPTDAAIKGFYDRLLKILKQRVLRDGDWRLLACTPAWEGNPTHDSFVAYAWQRAGQEPNVVAVNYAPHQSQCHVRLPLDGLAGRQWRLEDQFTGASYDWSGDDLVARGLYLDMAPWQACVFRVAPRSA